MTVVDDRPHPVENPYPSPLERNQHQLSTAADLVDPPGQGAEGCTLLGALTVQKRNERKPLTREQHKPGPSAGQAACKALQKLQF